jgi:enterochelin esterase-like enzyme
LPEPQSTAFFVLLMAAFAALICWLVLTPHVVFRVLAACLAFIPAVMFGVAAVNKYYDYYQNWNSAIADVTSQGLPGVPGEPGTDQHVPTSGPGITRLLGNVVYTSLAAADGYTLTLTVHGQASHLTRTVDVYLPPQYFQPAYRHYRFPAIELIHGYPGAPQDWITVLDVTTTLANLIHRGLAKPVVLVMPDANGARGISLQCLNSVDGPEDATFVAVDVQNYIDRVLRVWSPGRTWGIAGYSEGGFCAANLGLRYGDRFGLAGVLSGYFQPSDNQMGHPPHPVNPFGSEKLLRLDNTPTYELLHLPPGSKIPQFWIGSGTDPADLKAALVFKQLLMLRQPTVRLQLVPGGGHSMFTWRALIPSMLEWMTPKLADNVALAQARARRLAHDRPGPAPTAHPAVTR